MSYGLGGRHARPSAPVSPKGSALRGLRGDDLHLGLSSHELGLGSNFGLDAPDNVLSRAARVGDPPIISGIGRQADDRPSLKGLDSEMTGDSQHSSQDAKGSQASGDGSKNDSFKKDKEQAERSDALQEQGQILLQQQLAAERQADLPPTPTPPSPAASTAAVTQPAAPTLPDVSPVVTTALGSGEVTMIGAYFAQHGAPVAAVPASSVNVSVGGTVPDTSRCFRRLTTLSARSLILTSLLRVGPEPRDRRRPDQRRERHRPRRARSSRLSARNRRVGRAGNGSCALIVSDAIARLKTAVAYANKRWWARFALPTLRRPMGAAFRIPALNPSRATRSARHEYCSEALGVLRCIKRIQRSANP